MLAQGLPSSFFKTNVPAVEEYGIFLPLTVISCLVLDVVSTAGGAGNRSAVFAGAAPSGCGVGVAPPRPPRPGPWAFARETTRSEAANARNKFFIVIGSAKRPF